MRRLLVLLPVALAVLLATAPASARTVERDVRFKLHRDGFAIEVAAEDDGREEASAVLNLVRDRQNATYFAPATITAKRVSARFGRLGTLDFTYAQQGASAHRSPLGGEAVDLEGSFTFTGENGYVRFAADRAVGGAHEETYPSSYRGAPSRRLRRAVPYTPSYSKEGATLVASTRSRGSGRARELYVYDIGPGAGGRYRAEAFGYLWEKREGMIVSRGASLPMGARSFRWDLEAGTATVRPPAPFSGVATFARRPHGRPAWTGSLSIPILGGEPIGLAGPAFHAYLHRGVPQDE
jgi:hypothetical protein